MLLILSSRYVSSDLLAEFGRIPPVFLPLANKRLLWHQVALWHEPEAIYLTLPTSFNMPESDQAFIQQQGIQVVWLDEHLSLGESYQYALDMMPLHANSTLSVLFGDTLFDTLPKGANVISVGAVKTQYDWSFVVKRQVKWGEELSEAQFESSDSAVAGYFCFQKPFALSAYVEASNGDFVLALDRYVGQYSPDIVTADGWLDFGHLYNYFRSRMHFTTERAFNTLLIADDVVTKFSDDEQKIKAEAAWYVTLPDELKRFTPQFLGESEHSGRYAYELAYIYCLPLNELYTFAELNLLHWQLIISKCLEFIQHCTLYKGCSDKFTNNFSGQLINKTLNRLKGVSHIVNNMDAQWSFCDESPVSINEIIGLVSSYLPESDSVEVLSHGDFCFSNIFFDGKSQTIKVVDPRGLSLNSEQTSMGDYRYDVAKLAHSVIGYYDLIIAGRYSLELCEASHSLSLNIYKPTNADRLADFFIKQIQQIFGLPFPSILAMTIHLFLSMLPLHSDSRTRQLALFANTFRLYHLLKEEIV